MEEDGVYGTAQRPAYFKTESGVQLNWSLTCEKCGISRVRCREITESAVKLLGQFGESLLNAMYQTQHMPVPGDFVGQPNLWEQAVQRSTSPELNWEARYRALDAQVHRESEGASRSYGWEGEEGSVHSRGGHTVQYSTSDYQHAGNRGDSTWTTPFSAGYGDSSTVRLPQGRDLRGSTSGVQDMSMGSRYPKVEVKHTHMTVEEERPVEPLEHFWGYFLGSQLKARIDLAKARPMPAILFGAICFRMGLRHPLLFLGATAAGIGTIMCTERGSRADVNLWRVREQVLVPVASNRKVQIGIGVALGLVLVAGIVSPDVWGRRLLTAVRLSWKTPLLSAPLTMAAGTLFGHWLMSEPGIPGKYEPRRDSDDVSANPWYSRTTSSGRRIEDGEEMQSVERGGGRTGHSDEEDY